MSLESQLLMKQLMSQYFYLLNGKRPAKVIDIDGGVGQWDKILTKYGMIKCHPTGAMFYFRNRLDTAPSDVVFKIIYGQVFRPTGTFLQFMTGNANNKIQFLGYNGGHLELMRIQNQYVYLYNLPVADPVEAGALWNDSGTIKISSG